MPRRGWSAKLLRPIKVKGGRKLITLADVRAFVLDQPAHVQERRAWQVAAGLLLAAAEDARKISEVSQHVEAALFVERRLQGR
jgi:hypothetical protein